MNHAYCSGWPEILNRIGETVIVFDFNRADVAREILDLMLRGLLGDLRHTLGIEVRLANAAAGELRAHCLRDLSNGGRGIRNQVETHLLNPLARALFDAEAACRRLAGGAAGPSL